MSAGIQRATRESWGCDENVDGALFVGLIVGLLLGAAIAQAEEFGHVLYLGKTIG